MYARYTKSILTAAFAACCLGQSGPCGVPGPPSLRNLPEPPGVTELPEPPDLPAGLPPLPDMTWPEFQVQATKFEPPTCDECHEAQKAWEEWKQSVDKEETLATFGEKYAKNPFEALANVAFVATYYFFRLNYVTDAVDTVNKIFRAVGGCELVCDAGEEVCARTLIMPELQASINPPRGEWVLTTRSSTTQLFYSWVDDYVGRKYDPPPSIGVTLLLEDLCLSTFCDDPPDEVGQRVLSFYNYVDHCLEVHEQGWVTLQAGEVGYLIDYTWSPSGRNCELLFPIRDIKFYLEFGDHKYVLSARATTCQTHGTLNIDDCQEDWTAREEAIRATIFSFCPW